VNGAATIEPMLATVLMMPQISSPVPDSRQAFSGAEIARHVLARCGDIFGRCRDPGCLLNELRSRDVLTRPRPNAAGRISLDEAVHIMLIV
jgi:hypothetical protein